jgi:hypothetical protein
MSETFQPDDPGRFQPHGSSPASSPSGNAGGRQAGGSQSAGPGPVYVRSWGWSRQDPRPGLPWIGLVLVLFGGLLLLGELVPGLHVAGSAFGVAAGVAFLLAWATNNGRWGLYPGIFVLALSLPRFLIDLGLIQDAPGWSTLFLGVGLLVVAIARWRATAAIGWQGVIGAILTLGGGADLISALVPGAPSLDALIGPVILLSLGVLIIARSQQPRRR